MRPIDPNEKDEPKASLLLMKEQLKAPASITLKNGKSVMSLDVKSVEFGGIKYDYSGPEARVTIPVTMYDDLVLKARTHEVFKEQNKLTNTLLRENEMLKGAQQLYQRQLDGLRADVSTHWKVFKGLMKHYGIEDAYCFYQGMPEGVIADIEAFYQRNLNARLLKHDCTLPGPATTPKPVHDHAAMVRAFNDGYVRASKCRLTPTKPWPHGTCSFGPVDLKPKGDAKVDLPKCELFFATTAGLEAGHAGVHAARDVRFFYDKDGMLRGECKEGN